MTSRRMAVATVVALFLTSGSVYAAKTSDSSSASSSVSTSAHHAERAEVVALTNAARRRHGCHALHSDRRLSRAAQAHATDMAARHYFDHDTKGGGPWYDRLDAAGATGDEGENVARGQRDAATVVAAWMDSSEHRANILDCHFHRIGVGYEPHGSYWVQDFAQGGN